MESQNLKSGDMVLWREQESLIRRVLLDEYRAEWGDGPFEIHAARTINDAEDPQVVWVILERGRRPHPFASYWFKRAVQ